jgi:branched-chain amino acid transport system permease protein
VLPAVLFALLVVYPFVAPPYLLSLLTEVFIYGIFAMSLDLILGYTGLVSFGHAAFFGVGAYAEAIVFTHIGIGGGYRPFAVVPLIGLGVAVAAIPVAIVFLRVRGATFAIVTSPSTSTNSASPGAPHGRIS